MKISKKVVLNLCLTVFIPLGCLLASTKAQADFDGGNGTDQPYQISTCEQLQDIENYKDKNFILTRDVDCSATATWNQIPDSNPATYYGFTPIGQGAGYSGTFDGNGHNITHLYINRTGSNYIGLFADMNGTVTDLGLTDVDIAGLRFVGGLAGDISGGGVSGSYTTGQVSAQGAVGGLAGELSNGTLSTSYSEADVESSGEDWTEAPGSMGGGLVGYSWFSDIQKCYATGSVSGSRTLGGFVGFFGGMDSSVTESFASGDVTGTGDYLGGFVGFLDSYSSVENSYSTGDVANATGVASLVGGFVGINVGDVFTSYSTGDVSINSETSGDYHLGGFAGENNNDSIYSSFSVGAVTGNSDVKGGFIGSNVSSDYPNCGRLVQAGLNAIGDNAEAITDYEESGATVFYNKNHDIYTKTGEYIWDFNTAWIEYPNHYPILRNLSENVQVPDVTSNEDNDNDNNNDNTEPVNDNNNDNSNSNTANDSYYPYQPVIAVGNHRTYAASNVTLNFVSKSKVALRGKIPELTRGRVELYQNSHKMKRVKIKRNGRWRIPTHLRKKTINSCQLKYFNRFGQEIETTPVYQIKAR